MKTKIRHISNKYLELVHLKSATRVCSSSQNLRVDTGQTVNWSLRNAIWPFKTIFREKTALSIWLEILQWKEVVWVLHQENKDHLLNSRLEEVHQRKQILMEVNNKLHQCNHLSHHMTTTKWLMKIPHLDNLVWVTSKNKHLKNSHKSQFNRSSNHQPNKCKNQSQSSSKLLSPRNNKFQSQKLKLQLYKNNLQR